LAAATFAMTWCWYAMWPVVFGIDARFLVVPIVRHLS
jgi:hypothetical protein